MTMASADDLRSRLQAAAGPVELLDAAYDAFAAILALTREHDNPDSAYFVPMVFAAASAASGRDHVGRVSVLPPPPPGRQSLVPVLSAAEQAAEQISAMAVLLADALRSIPPAAVPAEDLRACEDAARCADEIADLMGGSRP
jgi:hypothetical protein